MDNSDYYKSAIKESHDRWCKMLENAIHDKRQLTMQEFSLIISPVLIANDNMDEEHGNKS